MRSDPGKTNVNMENKTNDFIGSSLARSLYTSLQEPVDVSSSNSSSSSSEDTSSDTQDGDNHTNGNASKQLVLYDPADNGTGEIVPVPKSIWFNRPPFQRYSGSNMQSRVLPSVGAFTVQCAKCFKWRLIPTNEKYEEIRERILENPFICEKASEWRPDISCHDPTDISQDGSRLWAIDKPNIARPPPGWQRLLRIRSEGSTKFADVDIPILKAVEEIMDPAAFCAVRFIISAIPFLPFVFQARDDVKTRNAGIELGLWVSLGYFAEALGLLTSDAGRASFISLSMVIVVPLLDGMLGAIIPARTWFGVLMSALGVGMLECSGSPPNVGDLLNFLSAIFFGIHMLRTERISRSIKKGNFLALLGYEVCVVALLSTMWVLVGGWYGVNQDFDQSLWTCTVLWDWMVAFPWVPALYTGVFSTGICLWIEIAAMREVSATETAIIYGMEPLWGAGFAWFLLGERWGTVGWIGAALVLGGSLLVQMYRSSSPNKSLEAEECKQKGNLLLIPELDKQKLQNILSTSPIVVHSKKKVTDMLK